MQSRKIAVVIGAGPAGLTAALELLRHTDIQPLVLEASSEIGGISRTVNHHGNRIDIGGHRFFSKSDWVMNWWLDLMPLEPACANGRRAIDIAYQNKSRRVEVDRTATIQNDDDIMLVRRRLSRIYYLRKFFDYPIKLNANTIRNLGISRIVRAGVSYAFAKVRPRHPEETLEDFFVNRFGDYLYRVFFKSYTEKVWGVPCEQISADWGAQRIKGLSISKAILHFVKTAMLPDSVRSQRKAQTSLIERFLYPKHGPGQLWELVAKKVQDLGGTVLMEHEVVGLTKIDGRITQVTVRELTTGLETVIDSDYVFSTMPVKDLMMRMTPAPPMEVLDIASSLPYRDFITVGLLVDSMSPNNQSMSRTANHMPPDNWIYIQESDVLVGRLQIFNNWSPGMVRDSEKAWIGLEYFCYEHDKLWNLSDTEMAKFAASELEKIGLIRAESVRDSHVIRVPKAYPAYHGSYASFDLVREFTDQIQNLFMVGRNGMHRYNNQDHSMLTAKLAVENIMMGRTDKANIWAVNIDDDYHEEDAKHTEQAAAPTSASSPERLDQPTPYEGGRKASGVA